MHDVLNVLKDRYESGSQPKHRNDEYRLAIVLEGGSSRAAYGGGMVAALEEYGLINAFDAVYGASAGALNGAWLTCERARANVHGWWTPESLKGSVNYRNALRGQPVVNGDFLIDDIYENFTQMGFDEILASDVEFHPVGTDADTGQSVDLAPSIHDKRSLKQALKATTRVPLLSGMPVELGGRRFIDGGMAENVPVPTALEQGATHVLVLRTKTPSLTISYEKPLKQRVVHRWMLKNAPGAVTVWHDRPRIKRDIEGLMAHHPAVYQVAPPSGAPKISMTSNSVETQKQAVEIGRTAMMRVLEPLLG